MERTDGIVPLVTRRADLLRAVASGATTRAAVADVVTVSRSTVDRSVRELVAEDLLEWVDDGLALTLPGRLALEAHDEMEAELDAVARTRELLAPLPPEADLPVVVLRGAAVEIRSETDPAATVRELVLTGDRIRACRGHNDGPDLVGLLAERPARVDLCLAEPRIEELLVTDRDRLGSLLGTEGVSVRTCATSPVYDLLLVEGEPDPRPTVAVLVYDGDGLRGTLRTDEPAAVDWARETVDRQWSAGTKLERL
jgi:predicted transcriptional regulator